jgi:uncharacterized protein (TIRG00374 family)
MNPSLKKTVQYTLSTLLTFGFLYFAFRGTDFPKLLEILSHANYWWALALLPPLIVSHLFRTWRWQYLLRPVKRTIRFRNLWSALCAGYMLNNILPKVGEIVRPLAIGKLEGISRSAAFGTLIVERIFDILSFLIMIALLPLLYSGPLLQIFPWLQETGIWISVLTLSALIVCVVLMMRRDLVVKLLGFVTRHLSPKRGEAVSRITHSFLDGFLFLKEPRHFVMIFVLSLLVWGLYFIMMYLPFFAFGLTERYGLDFRTAIVVQTISSLAYMAPTPGATGSYHYFTIESLTRLYGVDSELARSYATVTHAVGFIGITLIGLYYFWADKLHLAEFTKAKKHDAEPVA